MLSIMSFLNIFLNDYAPLQSLNIIDYRVDLSKNQQKKKFFFKNLSPDSPQSAETSSSRASQTSASPKRANSERSSDKLSWLSHYSTDTNAALVTSNLSSPSLPPGLKDTTSTAQLYAGFIFVLRLLLLLNAHRIKAICKTSQTRYLLDISAPNTYESLEVMTYYI